MLKKYVNDLNLQIAMSEYDEDNTETGHYVITQNKITVGRVSKVYDNEYGSGEQVFAVVPAKEYGKDLKEVSEVTVLPYSWFCY